VKLNLGCGTNKLPGWSNHDRDVDITKPLPWPTASADFIFIEHCVEHVKFHDAVRFFDEALRVLRPGGVLRVTVPSLEKLAESDNQRYYNWVHQRGWAPTPDRKGALHAMIFCHGHEAGWTASLMRSTLKYVGFDRIEECLPGDSSHKALISVEGHGHVIGDEFNALESMCFEGTKPGDIARNLDADYDAKFYQMHVGWRNEYVNIAKWLDARLHFNSAVDFGCGNGYILQALGGLGKAILGVDGSTNVLKHFPDAVIRDLTQPLDVGKHDVAICTEVAEHVEEKYADTLVDTVCNAAEHAVLFSAAKAGFGGHCHVNEQERPYWYAKFRARGFEIDEQLTTELCDMLRARNKQTWWFANNCFIARRSTAVAEQPAPGSRVAIVVGGAECWQRDLMELQTMFRGNRVEYYVVNDQIGEFPHPVVACTLHPDKLPTWLGQRKNNGLEPPLELWCHDGARKLNPPRGKMLRDWGGSSGLFAYQVAREHGHDKIVFCGVPMDSSPNGFRGQKWHAVTAFTRAWQTRHQEMLPYARSMSGWTAQLLGKPNEDWLR